MVRVNLWLLLVGAIATCAGCGFNDFQFATKYAPDLRRDGKTVSVFGAYKDGRMNAEAWSDVGPLFSAALGGAPCDSLHGDLLVNDHPVAEAIDDNARADGVTDELLAVFAPASAADAILVVTIAGRVPTTRTTPIVSQSPQAAAPNPRGMGARGAGVAGAGLSPVDSGGPGAFPSSPDPFEMSARLYSVRERRTVAVVSMTYTGKNGDEAMASFIARLRAELPGLKCQPWNRELHIDADRVRTARPTE